MSLVTFTKDPGERKDYRINWGPWLEGDTISSSAWAITPVGAASVHSHEHSTTTATVMLEGGLVDCEYRVTNTIETAGGRRAKKRFRLKVAEEPE